MRVLWADYLNPAFPEKAGFCVLDATLEQVNPNVAIHDQYEGNIHGLVRYN